MNNTKLPDTPWHIGYVKKKENDPRRHKSRCIYNDGRKCSNPYMSECLSSSHCKFYAETKKQAERFLVEMKIRYHADAGGIVKGFHIQTFAGKKYKPNTDKHNIDRQDVQSKADFILHRKLKKKNLKKENSCPLCCYFSKVLNRCGITNKYENKARCLFYKLAKKVGFPKK